MAAETEALIRRELIANAGIQLEKVVSETLQSVDSQKQQADQTIERIYDLNKSVDSIQETTNSIDAASQSLQSKSDLSAIEISKATAKMKELEERFEPILNSINIIDSIADSTKLLAVNATIQAAKAGEAGRSFAVVAKEIQELSTSTQKTNKTITEGIGELRAVINGLSQTLGTTVDSLEDVRQNAESNRTEVSKVIDNCVVLSQKMSETHAGSLKIQNTTDDLVQSFTEVSTINDTFEAILSLMAQKEILSSKNDAMLPFEALAAESEFADSSRFVAKEEEYVLQENDILISSTDTKGIITYGNRTFYKIAQFDKAEMDGLPHNCIRHPDMPRSAFKHLWDTIQAGDIWQGIVLNKGKLGRVYWVRAIVFPVFKNNSIVGYISVRSKPTSNEIERAKKTYQKLP